MKKNFKDLSNRFFVSVSKQRICSKLAILVVCALGFFQFQSCVPPSDSEGYGAPVQDFKSDLTKRIYALQNEQNFDSLALYISSPDPMARFCATRAFGSFITADAIPLIAERLQDSVREIRTEAAWVAGQLGDSTLADEVLAIFEADKSKEIDHVLNMQVLEAIGKIAPASYLSLLASSSDYPTDMPFLTTGKALAFYHFALRGKVEPKATQKMINFLVEDYSQETKLIAANYLSRAKDIELDEYKFQLLQAFIKSEDMNTKIALAAATAKSGSDEILSPFLDELKKAKDKRIVISGIRQIHNFKYIEIIDYVLELLTSTDIHIALAAAEFLRQHGQFGDVGFYLEYQKKVKNTRVKHALQGAILGIIKRAYVSTRGRITKELTEEFNASNKDYEKAEIITAMGRNPYLFKEVSTLSFGDSSLVVRTKGVEAIGAILTDFLPNESRTQQRYLAPIAMKLLNDALDSTDVGMIAAAAYSIANTDKDLISRSVDYDKLNSALNKLKMPQDLEAINYLIEAINKHFPAKSMEKKKAEKLRDFDLQGLAKLSDNISATIRTTRGDFIVELYGNHAPSSVLNFIDLSQQDYFTDKFFHRVVSNFVIQAGCPRGDGFGSENYVIRSDLSPMRYLDEGYLGMASAGKHTESTQWFVTHSSTPHLSGNYTIFGKVKSGMDVVNAVQVGDKITEIVIVNPQAKSAIEN